MQAQHGRDSDSGQSTMRSRAGLNELPLILRSQKHNAAQRGGPADSLLKIATTHFNDKRFAQSIPLFETLLKTDPQNAYLHYYYAVALLQNGQTDQSRNELNQLHNGPSLFRDDAAFYLALSYLKEQDKARCREWLNKISVDAPIHAKAGELLKKL